MIHKPVLLKESLEYLITDRDGIYFDGTIGFGGHSSKILEKLSEKGLLVGTDKDQDAFDHSSEKFKEDKRVKLFKTGYGNINIVSKIEFIKGYDGIFADLGVSSYQLDNPDSGFTYREDGPLDMRMDKSQGISAAYVVNTFSEEDIANIIYKYGEERKSRVIARKIVDYRRSNKIRTTAQLRGIVENVIRGKYKMNSLSRVFQALRIFVNDEIEELKLFLEKAAELLKPNGRLVILTYHSLEDREVKEFFKVESTDCICPPEVPVCVCEHKKTLKVLTRKPLLPQDEEIAENVRARSGKLRAAEKL